MPTRERFPHSKTNAPKKPKKKKSTVTRALCVVGILTIALAAIALYAPFSPFAHKKPPFGPKLMVGNNPYVYACEVLDAARTAATLHINGDTNKENVQQEYAFDPADTSTKPVDLLALTGSDTIASTCRLKYDRVYVTGADNKKAASFINVTASLMQYADPDTAAQAFENAKKSVPASTQQMLASLNDSFYIKPTPAKGSSTPTYIRPTVLYKNMLIKLSAPLAADDSDGSKMSSQLGTVVRDMQSRITVGKGLRPSSYSGATKVGTTPFVDACSALNYRKLAASIDGGIELNPVSAQAIQGLAPDDTTLPGITGAASNCSFTFRTTEDKKAQETQKAPEATTPAVKAKIFNNRYPHYFNARIMAVNDSAAAKKFVSTIKQQTEANSKKSTQNITVTISDQHMGDAAIKIVSTPKPDPKATGGVYDSQVYYVAKDAYVFQFSAYFTRQSQPYTTTSHKLSDQEMQTILKLFSDATTWANK